MWVGDEVFVGVGLGCEGKEERETQKDDFRQAVRYTFIISRTFARGRYSLIV